MRPNVTRRNNWAHLGIGACALVLPPLALGAAFYSMLAAPDERAARPAGAQADIQATGPALIARPAKAEPELGEPPVGKSTEEVARKWDPVSAQGGPVQVAVPPAAVVNPRTAGGAPPAVDGPPAPAAPKRANRRHVQRQQQGEFALQNWLQQIGILPRSSAGGS